MFEQPKDVDDVSIAFGGHMDELLPDYDAIPAEFKRGRGEWVQWQQQWFFNGLVKYPSAKEGIDPTKAMRHLAAIQSSFEPKHEHKEAAVAYLASLWFEKP